MTLPLLTALYRVAIHILQYIWDDMDEDAPESDDDDDDGGGWWWLG